MPLPLSDGERDVLREQEADARDCEEAEPPDCPVCRGTGEGPTDAELCGWCHGFGVNLDQNHFTEERDQ